MGRFPRFPSGGTNRIRFKGYNLSRMAPPSKMLITKLQNAATPLQIYAKNPILCNTLISRAEKDTPFPRRTVPRMLPRGLDGHFLRGKLPRSIPGELDGSFPRGRLHFFIPGIKKSSAKRQRTIICGRVYKPGPVLQTGKPKGHPMKLLSFI